ncbi:MAG: dephospho-CoA kinase [Promicromonosporaceae bacterium]|nr:dephospho-CoA kinase [Promicromonosporaceae bacterium]
MLRIALTGGIGAGKSTTARRLAELGAVVIDHDELAREAVALGSPGLADVVARFGRGVLADDGALNRTVLGERVFDDDAELEALEQIIHPEVRRLAIERQAAAIAADPAAVVVHDIPLLVETGQAGDFGLVLVVHAPAEVRLRRLVTERGMGQEEAHARIAAQATDEQRLAVADVVLDSTGPLAKRLHLIDELWQHWLTVGATN